MKTILLYILSFTLLFCIENDEILEMYQNEIDKVQLSRVFDNIDKKYIYKISIQFDEILFYLVKIQNQWKISYDEEGYLGPVENYLLDGIFYHFNKLEAKRIIHKDEQYWNKYNLDDINAFKIKFFSKKNDIHKNHVFGINNYNKVEIYSRIDDLSENVYLLNEYAQNVYKFLIDIVKYYIEIAPLNGAMKFEYSEIINFKEENFMRQQSAIVDKFILYDKAPVPKTPLGALIIYPELAREAGIEGKVFIRAFINTKGIVTATKIVKGLPNTGLDEAALSAVKKSRWYPARQRDKKVGIWVTIPVDFSLTN